MKTKNENENEKIKRQNENENEKIKRQNAKFHY